jgi:cellulose synthase/poly-beta-1,6-N-acetylglucosamine synthase-like glycosyltransferase
MSSKSTDPRVAVVIPAYNEEGRIAATVGGASAIPGVGLVVVVDDGSSDATSELAEQAGAHVVRSPANRGKAAAMELGAATVTDLEQSAERAAPLVTAVRDGAADVAIATLPAQPGGGRGFVVNLARAGVLEATGWTAEQPLSGQRAMTRDAFAGALPLAHGFGVEVGMTIDVLAAGFRVVEVPVDLRHRVTGSDWRAQVHRGKQFWAVWRALRSRGVGPRLPVPR